jgi:hypothetical protein
MDFNISGIYTFLSKEQEILYVGKTVKLLNRIRQHLTDEKEWKKDIFYVDFMKCDNETDREILETYCINYFNPIYNLDKVYNVKPSIQIELPITDRYLLSEIYNYRPVLKYYIGTFKDCCKQAVEDNYIPEEVEKYYPLIKEGYEKLGAKKLKALGYCSTKIKNELYNLDSVEDINKEILKTFESGKFYSSKDVKLLLFTLYCNLGINKNPKANDLESVYNIRSIRKIISNKQVRGYEIP